MNFLSVGLIFGSLWLRFLKDTTRSWTSGVPRKPLLFFTQRVIISFNGSSVDRGLTLGLLFQFEHEIITKLDSLVEEGKGDEHYKDLFYTL